MSSLGRIRRLLRLVEVLKSGRALNSQQLSDYCNVSRRTIFRDLKTLGDSGVDVVYDEQRQGYLLPSSMMLPPTGFTLDETLSLLLLCNELGDAAHGIPFQGAASSAALKLMSNLPRQLRDLVGEISESISIQLDARNPLSGSKMWFEQLKASLAERRQVRIEYRSLTEGEAGTITTLLSPYRILFKHRSWYVIGRSSLHRQVRTFNVGRILNMTLIDSRYQIPPRFSLERYLGDAWSLIRERNQRFDVIVRFQRRVAWNVSEVQWHRTQQIIWNDDETIDFHCTVEGLSEIIWWILGYGDQAEVLQPPELRERVRQHIAAMSQVYGSAGGDD